MSNFETVIKALMNPYFIFLVPPIVASFLIYIIVHDPNILSDGDIPVYSDCLNCYGSENKTFSNFHLQSIYIPVGKEDQIHGWVFIPVSASVEEPVPLIILAHGLGAQKDMGLAPYAEKFASVGYASLVIDYVTFGGSYSQRSRVRNYINPWNHIKDITKSLNFVRAGGLGNLVDVDRIALWGSSFAGGHMIMVAQNLLNAKLIAYFISVIGCRKRAK